MPSSSLAASSTAVSAHEEAHGKRTARAPRSRPSTSRDPAYNWVTAVPPPRFSRADLFTKHVVLPRRKYPEENALVGHVERGGLAKHHRCERDQGWTQEKDARKSKNGRPSMLLPNDAHICDDDSETVALLVRFSSEEQNAGESHACQSGGEGDSSCSSGRALW